MGNMITAVDCCNGCPRQGCGAYHDKCPQYQAQTAKRKADKAGVAKQKAFYNYICEEMEKVECFNRNLKLGLVNGDNVYYKVLEGRK